MSEHDRERHPGSSRSGPEPRPAPPRTHLDRYALEVDERLVFDPDSEWFSDVPLVTIAADRSWSITRGQLTDAEAAAVTEAANGWASSFVETGPHVMGVFTDLFEHTTIEQLGTTFADDPRDVVELDLASVLAGQPDLEELRRRVTRLAAALDRAAASGLIVYDRTDRSVFLTDAPDRVG